MDEPSAISSTSLAPATCCPVPAPPRSPWPSAIAAPAGWACSSPAHASSCPPRWRLSLLAWAYVRYGGLPQPQGLLYGAKPVMVAIILQAVWRLGRIGLSPLAAGPGGLGLFAAALAGAPPIAVLLVSGVLLLLAWPGRVPSPMTSVRRLAWAALRLWAACGKLASGLTSALSRLPQTRSGGPRLRLRSGRLSQGRPGRPPALDHRRRNCSTPSPPANSPLARSSPRPPSWVTCCAAGPGPPSPRWPSSCPHSSWPAWWARWPAAFANPPGRAPFWTASTPPPWP